MPIQATPSPVILGFAFLLSLLTGVIFGIVPAWTSSHANPAEVLRGMNRSTDDRSLLPQKTLIVFQAALSLVLLVGAALMTQTLRNLEHQNLGITTANRYVIHFDPMGAGYNLETIGALNQRIEDEFKALPGVKSAGLALYSTLEGNNWGESIFVEGRPAPGPGENHNSSWDRVSPQFFQTIGQPVIRGRGFTDQDTATSAMVAVVNQAFVKKFFHTLRHTFGTLLKANGEDVAVVQSLMRHANVSVTMNHYVQAVTPAKRQAQRGIVGLLDPNGPTRTARKLVSP